ncbi:PTR2-domain-containing protein [Aspergillus pseudonomiae]|uniref:PTR2-domain-containing protein n=1 Tax=Aspergillus pseudonomiae TaxID=1506151 RepID=A0A5N7DI21_9EURO|nr:PTR2-domain-containing protein [Aspergillus pseudonomiae]KAE8405769.1 PTR2-domain-containing protein [Aspergillus pseudonomiae]
MPESTGTPNAPDHQILPTGTHSDTPKPLQVGQAYEPGLRRVPDRIPWVVALIIVVELGERFTYFGLSGPLQNYIKNPYVPGADLPGALGKGQAVASALGNFFKFWAYASTILGAVVADQYVGKFKAIVIASGIYIVGLTILVATATPAAINGGSAFGGLVASMVIIGLGTGGIKANVTPFCAEQYNKGSAFVKTLKSGERVVVDPELTVERMFMWFYWAVNIGALSPLITVNVEAKVSFWLAFLIPLIVIVLAAIVFICSSKLYVKTRPQGSPIVETARTVYVAISERGFENAKPSSLSERGRLAKYSIASSANYTDQSVDGVKKGIRACKLFLLFPFYFICWVQIWNNLISQAGQMALHGTPNDLLQNLDPIALIIFIPFLDLVVYPALRHFKIDFRPELKITVGFFMASMSMVYASVLQHYIYISPAQTIHVWVQTPAYVLVAFSEAFVVVTGLEIAYTSAPESLRSLVSSLFWLTIGVAAAICIGLAPVSQDPYLVWMYGSLAIVGFVAGILFYVLFGRASDQPVPVLDSVETTIVGQREDEEAQVGSGKCYDEYCFPGSSLVLMAHNDIVVLGAGIIGLNVALELSKRGYGQHITIMAEHLPGDESIDYTSPWAGANFSGISGSDANALRWDRSGYLAMMRLIDTGAEEAKYLSKTESTEYWDQAPSQDKIISMTEYLHDLVIIPPSDLPKGVAFGIRFTTVTLNAPAHCEYLKYLLSQPQYGGIKFVRRKVSSLQDAFLYGTQIVFNCIGNAASSLAGVADLKCYPTRGQIILVKAPSVRVNVMRHGKDYETYIIPRPRSDGTVILGGYLQPGDQTRQTRPVETESILSRTEGLLPILKNGETEILHVAVGLRPSRQGGARVELETTPEGHTVVHNYGAGGTGFQAGMGMAKDAVDLASDILSQLRPQSRL